MEHKTKFLIFIQIWDKKSYKESYIIVPLIIDINGHNKDIDIFGHDNE